MTLARSGVLTASARTAPAWICPMAGGSVTNSISTLPAATSLIAAVAPWNGTCTMSIFCVT